MKFAIAIAALLLTATAAIAVEEKPIWQQEAEAAAEAVQNPLLNNDQNNIPTNNELGYSPGEGAQSFEETAPTATQEEQIRYRPSDNPNISEIKIPPKEDSKKSEEISDQEKPAEETTPELPKWAETNSGKVKILNKIFTRTTEIELAKNIAKKSGALTITIEKCFRRPESDRKESAALILIKENFKSAATVEIFHGWMFSDSPAISALEHQQYDVILLSCEDAKKVETPSKDDKKDNKKTEVKNDKNKEPAKKN